MRLIRPDGIDFSSGFFRLWMLKEAYIEATGIGLAQRLAEIEAMLTALVIR